MTTVTSLMTVIINHVTHAWRTIPAPMATLSRTDHVLVAHYGMTSSRGVSTQAPHALVRYY